MGCGKRRSLTVAPAGSGTNGPTGAVGNGTVPAEFVVQAASAGTEAASARKPRRSRSRRLSIGRMSQPLRRSRNKRVSSYLAVRLFPFSVIRPFARRRENLKRIKIGASAAALAFWLLSGSAHAGSVAQLGAAPPPDFGTPPSGEVPILFNDVHVYAKPDRIKQNRALAALVRGNTILVPLRSMFEQMGATVSYDAASRTVDVSKAGADIKVTVGRPEVVINGESRPLDVPPEIYHGAVVVPVRVISEGMGAYVQWVPDRRIVVVRYVPAVVPTPAPTPIATPIATPLPPTPVPTPTPTAVPTKNPYEHFIVGDYIFSPKVYNEFSPGNTGKGGSYSARGAVEFPAFGLPWMLEGDYRSYSYPHNSGISPAFLGGPNP